MPVPIQIAKTQLVNQTDDTMRLIRARDAYCWSPPSRPRNTPTPIIGTIRTAPRSKKRRSPGWWKNPASGAALIARPNVTKLALANPIRRPGSPYVFEMLPSEIARSARSQAAGSRAAGSCSSSR